VARARARLVCRTGGVTSFTRGAGVMFLTLCLTVHVTACAETEAMDESETSAVRRPAHEISGLDLERAGEAAHGIEARRHPAFKPLDRGQVDAGALSEFALEEAALGPPIAKRRRDCQRRAGCPSDGRRSVDPQKERSLIL
jgi:hypothetical protein